MINITKIDIENIDKAHIFYMTAIQWSKGAVMTTEEKKLFLFEQTCVLLAGRLGNEKCTLSPKTCIDEHFEKTYKALADEFDKHYTIQHAK